MISLTAVGFAHREPMKDLDVLLCNKQPASSLRAIYRWSSLSFRDSSRMVADVSACSDDQIIVSKMVLLVQVCNDNTLDLAWTGRQFAQKMHGLFRTSVRTESERDRQKNNCYL